jgi:gliding motility-associated-like protein
MPNAFTPNNDGKNDEFKGKGYLQAISNFNLSIWNRWGQMVFETDNPTEGWNGQFGNSGAMSPQGVYVYKANYTDPRGEKKKVEGHVTLLR